MNILVIGSGGREHALVWKLKQSHRVKKIYCCPGNGGIAQDAEVLPSPKEGGWAAYVKIARDKNIDLTVVGPEIPLAEGIADFFRSQNLPIFGPSRDASRLEASKIFAKNFMMKHGIPTADFQVFEEPEKAFSFVDKLAQFPQLLPMVVKADGLAAGKGVSVCSTAEEVRNAVQKMMIEKSFGPAGEKILIEKGLSGPEISLMALCDGKTIKTLNTARDYKRVFDGNKGPNTGGMGAVSPSPISEYDQSRIAKEIAERFLMGIQSDGLDFRGLIYFGIMLTPLGPKVLEFNVRFGDPEAEVLLPLIRSDLSEILLAVSQGRLSETDIEFDSGHCVTVVCCSEGYPGSYPSHREISGIPKANALSDSAVFHSGTTFEDGKFYTAGGRVLNCVGWGKTFEEAQSKAYELAGAIRFEGQHYRRDIGASNAALGPVTK